MIVKIPELKISGYDLPNVKGIGELPSMKGIQNSVDLGNIPKVDIPTDDIGNVTQQVQGYQQDIKNITGGNAGDVQKLPEAIESQAGKIDGMDELQKQSGIIDQQKAKLDMIKDPEQAKEKAVEMAKKAAIDHFAGKEEQLNAAMERISKYKQKYSSVSSIKDDGGRAGVPVPSQRPSGQCQANIYHKGTGGRKCGDDRGRKR